MSAEPIRTDAQEGGSHLCYSSGILSGGLGAAGRPVQRGFTAESSYVFSDIPHSMHTRRLRSKTWPFSCLSIVLHHTPSMAFVAARRSLG